MIGESEFIKSFLANETIVVDTREQKPYTFSGFSNVRTVRHKLPFCDYSIRGFERDIVVERKTLEDYVGSITGNNHHFVGKLIKNRPQYSFIAIVVEGHWSDILGIPDSSGHSCLADHPGINVNSLIGTTMSIQCSLEIPVFFAGDRMGAQIWTVQYLAWAWKAVAREKRTVEMLERKEIARRKL